MSSDGAEGPPADAAGSATTPPHRAASDVSGPSRLRLALAMIVVAGLGAYVALLAALTEEEASQLERRHAQGRLIELTERQNLLDLGLARANLDEHARELRARADQFDAEAARLKASNPLVAVEFSLRAHEERAAYRALRPFMSVLPSPFDGGDIEESLRRQVASKLVRMGFETEWERPPPNGASAQSAPERRSIWRRLDHAIEETHGQVLGLAFGVLMFVTALTLFTVADLRREQGDGPRAFGFAIAIAAGATAWIFYVSHASHWSEIALVLGLALALCTAVWFRSRVGKYEDSGEYVEPGEWEPRVRVGLELPRSPHAFERRIVALIAVTVLLSALAGYLYSDAQARSSGAAHEALRQEVESHARSTRLRAITNDWLLGGARFYESRARATAARQRIAHLEALGDSAGANRARAEAETDLAAAESVLSRDAIALYDAAFHEDARFPEQTVFQAPLRRLENNRFEPFALWDSFSQRSFGWHRKAAVYLASLTVFVIALYLFGQARNMGTGAAPRPLVYFGALLVIIATGIGTFEAFHPVATVTAAKDATGCKTTNDFGPVGQDLDRQAAWHYAVAQMYLGNARDDAGYARAAQALECATEMRDDFALAKAQLASVKSMIGSPQRGDQYGSLIAKDVLARVVQLRENALATWRKSGYVEPAAVLSSLGFDRLELALVKGDRGELEHALRDLQAAEKSPNDGGDARGLLPALIHFNLSTAHLALGSFKEADAELKSAIASGGARSHDLAVSAFTDMEIVLAHCSRVLDAAACKRLEGEVARRKGELVAAAWHADPAKKDDRSPPARPSQKVLDPMIVTAPDGVRWYARFADLREGDRVAIVWYAKDADWNTWRALPELTGAVSPRELVDVRSRVVRRSFNAGSYFERCMNGKREDLYRAEFYVNGKLAEITQTTLQHPAHVADRILDLGVALCVPAAWQRGRPFADQAPRTGYLFRSFDTKDKQPALVLGTFYAPDPELRAVNWVAVMQRAMRQLQWTDGSEPTVSFDGAGRCPLDAPAPSLIVREWRTSDRLHVIGIGLTRHAAPREICGALSSIEALYPPPAKPVEPVPSTPPAAPIRRDGPARMVAEPASPGG